MNDLGSLGDEGDRIAMSALLWVLTNWTKLLGTVISQWSGECPFNKWLFSGGEMYGSGQMVNLNTLLYGPGKNYRLFSATAINDNGQIVANAYDMPNGGIRAVLLTPTGPPRPPVPGR